MTPPTHTIPPPASPLPDLCYPFADRVCDDPACGCRDEKCDANAQHAAVAKENSDAK